MLQPNCTLSTESLDGLNIAVAHAGLTRGFGVEQIAMGREEVDGRSPEENRGMTLSTAQSALRHFVGKSLVSLGSTSKELELAKHKSSVQFLAA